MSMRGLSFGGFCLGEQTLPWIGLAIKNKPLKYYKKICFQQKIDPNIYNKISKL